MWHIQSSVWTEKYLMFMRGFHLLIFMRRENGSKKSLFLVFAIIVFAIFYYGFEERVNSELVSKNLIDKQQEISDISYDEKLTMFIGNESITTESSFLIKKPNMYKRVDRVNSSTCLTIGSDGTLTW